MKKLDLRFGLVLTWIRFHMHLLVSINHLLTLLLFKNKWKYQF